MHVSANRGRTGNLDAIQFDAFKSVMSRFSTGVVVVTATDEGLPVGLTCQSLCSLSLDPPLILFCPAKSSASWPRIRNSGYFCVNVLAQHQHDLSRRFAKSGGPKFDGVSWRAGPLGSPRLDEAIAYIDCQVEAIHDAGDHEITVGRVLALDQREDAPLIFYRNQYRQLATCPTPQA